MVLTSLALLFSLVRAVGVVITIVELVILRMNILEMSSPVLL